MTESQELREQVDPRAAFDARVDAGELPGSVGIRGMDRTWKALDWITGIDKFDRWLDLGFYQLILDTPDNPVGG